MAPVGGIVYGHRWISFRRWPDRYGNPCRIITSDGRPPSGYCYESACVIEFPDGLRVEATRACVKPSGKFLSRGYHRSVAHQVLMRIRRSPRRTFTLEDLADIDPEISRVSMALVRLARFGAIARVDRGRYRSRP